VYLGEARVEKFAEESTVQILKSAQEIYVGDRLLAAGREIPNFGYVPRAPQTGVRARIVAAYGGLSETGPLSIVTLSKGRQDGLEVGTRACDLSQPEQRPLRLAHIAPLWPRGSEREQQDRGPITAMRLRLAMRRSTGGPRR
jgi:hypothetical protein